MPPPGSRAPALAASAKLGHSTVPALVGDLSDQEKLELALVDNLQRQDLSILEPPACT